MSSSGGTPPDDLRQIVGLTWTVNDEWVSWEPGDGSARAEELALARCGDPDLAAALAAGIRVYEDAFARDGVPAMFLALWVPDPASPPAATAIVSLVGTNPATGRRRTLEERLEFVRTRGAAKGFRLIDSAALPSRVVAGEAVLEVTDVAPRFHRVVQRAITWYILPPGTEDTVAFECESDLVAHFDLLADHAMEIANTIVVHLEDA